MPLGSKGQGLSLASSGGLEANNFSLMIATASLVEVEGIGSTAAALVDFSSFRL